MNSKKTPYVIAVCHQKGGVAKTTTVASLGAALVEQGYDVLLIDLDPSGNLTSALGLNPKEMPNSAANIFLNTARIESTCQPSNVEKMDVIPANQDMLSLSKALHQRSGYEHNLRKALKKNKTVYDYVLIDCPPALDAITISALTAADLAIIPTQCEYFSLQALNNVFAIISTVRTAHNPQLHYRLLVTMFDRRGNLHTDVLKYFKAHHANALFETEIGFDTKIKTSQTVGVPLNEFSPNTRAAKQYRALANEILAYV